MRFKGEWLMGFFFTFLVIGFVGAMTSLIILSMEIERQNKKRTPFKVECVHEKCNITIHQHGCNEGLLSD